MRKHFDYVPCTVLLAASQLTEMLSAVDDWLIKHRESDTDSLMRIGSELHDVSAVLRSRHHLFEFIKNLDLPPSTLTQEKELSSLDMMLQDKVNLTEERYLYEANFYSIRVLMAIYEELEEKLYQDDLRT
jgi:exopolyphosphatase/pppGpp-phosphohydrolase